MFRYSLTPNSAMSPVSQPSTVVNTPAIGEAPADVRRASDQHHGRRHG